MRLENNLDKILIIDFGSQFTQLIARKVRELKISEKNQNLSKLLKRVFMKVWYIT